MKAKIEEDKKILRDHFRKRIRHQSMEARQSKSRIITDLVIDLPAYRKSRTVMLYVALDEEVDTRAILERARQDHKVILLPVILASSEELICAELKNSGRMKPGKYGIMEPEDWSEPFPLAELDLVIVPGLAFDKKNHRLGRGKGYYDRFLAKLDSKVSTLGLAYDVQLTEELPVSSHDVKLDLVIHN